MAKYVYVILTKTLTVSGKVICKISRNDYSHASLALDKELNEIYSFARFHYQNPVVGGFVRENVETLSLGRDEEVTVKIFRIPVTVRQYRKLRQNVEYFKRNEKKYMYNLLALLLFPTGIQFPIRDSYICTEFVATILRESDIEKEKLKKGRLTPSEMIKAFRKYEYYNGSLQEYVATVQHEECESRFLERENIFLVIGKSIKQIGKLLYRKIM